jgi:hypothetical protein
MKFPYLLFLVVRWQIFPSEPLLEKFPRYYVWGKMQLYFQVAAPVQVIVS